MDAQKNRLDEKGFFSSLGEKVLLSTHKLKGKKLITIYAPKNGSSGPKIFIIV